MSFVKTVIELVQEEFPVKKGNGPAQNQQKQLKEFPFGEGNDPSAAAGAGGVEAFKQMQQQQADKERTEMQLQQQKNAEEDADRKRLKDLQIKAEKEVAEDLNSQYVDQDDKVEFYPQLESFKIYSRKL